MVLKNIIGNTYNGKVDSIVKFGAFIYIKDLNSKGLLHISQISDGFVNDVNDFLQENEIINVKVIDIKDGNKLSLKLVK